MADAILPQFKKCTGCEREKSLSEFGKSKTGRYGLASNCKSCVSVRNAKWRADNPDYIAPCLTDRAAYASAWRARNPESSNASQKKFREKHKETLARKALARAKADWPKHLARTAEWAKKNPEKIRENQRSAYSKNPDAFIDAVRRRRALKAGSSDTHTLEEINDLLRAQDYRCACCEVSFEHVKKHLDHWIALSRGGSDGIGNLQWLCARCNTSKKDRDPIDWLVGLFRASYWPKVD